VKTIGCPVRSVRTRAFAYSRVARHQRVYTALGERMREEIHALSMTTLTPGEWAERGGAQQQ